MPQLSYTKNSRDNLKAQSSEEKSKQSKQKNVLLKSISAKSELSTEGQVTVNAFSGYTLSADGRVSSSKGSEKGPKMNSSVSEEFLPQNINFLDDSSGSPQKEAVCFLEGKETQYLNLGLPSFRSDLVFHYNPEASLDTLKVGNGNFGANETLYDDYQDDYFGIEKGGATLKEDMEVEYLQNSYQAGDLSSNFETFEEEFIDDELFTLQNSIHEVFPGLENCPNFFLDAQNNAILAGEGDMSSFLDYMNSCITQDDIFSLLNFCKSTTPQSGSNTVVESSSMMLEKGDFESPLSYKSMLPNSVTPAKRGLLEQEFGHEIYEDLPVSEDGQSISQSSALLSRNSSFFSQNGLPLTDNGAHAGLFAANMNTSTPNKKPMRKTSFYLQHPTPVSPSGSLALRKNSRLLSGEASALQMDFSVNTGFFPGNSENTVLFEDDAIGDERITLADSLKQHSTRFSFPGDRRNLTGSSVPFPTPNTGAVCSGLHPKKKPCVDCFTPTSIGKALGITVEPSNVQCLTVVVNYHDYVGTITRAGVLNERLVNTRANPSKQTPVATINTLQNGILEVSTVLQRRRYTRNIDELFGSVSNMTYVASRSFRPNNPYEPQYYRFEVFNGKLINKSKCGLCPFCEQVRFLPFKNSTYLSHLTLEHGVFANNFLIPEGLNYGLYDNAATGRRLRAVQCAVCLKVVETGCWSIKTNPLLSYFRHFKKKHSTLTWEFSDCIFAPIVSRGRGLKGE